MPTFLKHYKANFIEISQNLRPAIRTQKYMDIYHSDRRIDKLNM